MSQAERRRLEALYRECSPLILRFAYSQTGSMDEAQEVVSETFLVAWRRVQMIPEDAATSWLYGVARKVIANHRRSRRRQDRLVSKTRAQRVPTGEPADEGVPERTDLARAMDKLSLSQRTALELSYWEDIEPAEAAKMLGCSRVAYNMRLHRARARLGEALGGKTAREEVAER